MYSSLRGFSHALSPQGKAQLVGPLPWHYSQAVIGITYKADQSEIKKVLPEPYELSAIEPDGASCNFLSCLSIWEEDKELIITNPQSAQYLECQITVRCSVNGVEGRRCVYAWVDKDFVLLRGWFYGFPKKLGNIQLAFNQVGLYDLCPGLEKPDTGTKFTAFMEAHGERLTKGTIELVKQVKPAELPASANLKWLNLVHFPSTDIEDRKPYVHQIVTPVYQSSREGEAWTAVPKNLEYYASELEEHLVLKPIKLTGAYYLTKGQTMIGTKIVHNYLK